MSLRKVFAFALVIMLLILGGCGSPPEITTGEITLLVTKDFGEGNIFNKQIQLDSQISVMELLNQHLDVKTEYGGGFVNSISGLESGYTNATEKEKLDWFYFSNGIMTSVGATEYYPTNKDVIWWDYHPWGNIPFTPAIIGAFPQPFLNGYQGNNPGTVILADSQYEQLAFDFAEHLKSIGVKDVSVEPYEEKLAADRSKITLVIAEWKELSESNFWQGVQENRDKTGWFAELETDAFHGLNEESQRQKTYQEGVGAILATGMGMGDGTPLWLVTGLDKAGIVEAVEILINDQQKIEKSFGALVYEKSVIALPIYQ